MPTPAIVFAAILFGSIGMGAFMYGKKAPSLKALIVGILLMVFPYFVSNTLLLYVVGGALTCSLLLNRD